MLPSLTDTVARHFETGIRAPQYEDTAGTSLRDALAGVPDPRARRGVRYPFMELLHLIVCAVISGTRTLTMITQWTHDAASSAPVFKKGRLPSLATIHRVTARIDPVTLDDIVSEWIRDRAREKAPRGRRVIAIHGKEVRGAKNGSRDRVFLTVALDHTTGMVIGQESIGQNTNEIPHFAHLMDKIGDLIGTVVAAGVLHTQRERAEYLHARGAHYVLTAKNNQRALRDRVSFQP